MSFSNPGDDPPLLLPIPADALLLPAVTNTAGRTPWLLALSALRQDLAQRGLDLPLEAAASREDGSAVVTLNGFRVQVVWAGLWADSLAIPTSAWRQADAAPQAAPQTAPKSEAEMADMKAKLDALQRQLDALARKPD